MNHTHISIVIAMTISNFSLAKFGGCHVKVWVSPVKSNEKLKKNGPNSSRYYWNTTCKSVGWNLCKILLKINGFVHM